MRGAILALCLAFAISGCNRAGFRIPGAAGSFHPAVTNYEATSHRARDVFVAAPVDERREHIGERVAGTSWTGCRTDPFWRGSMPTILSRELERELAASGLFENVSRERRDPGALVLEARVHAFCASAFGFLSVRVAGIVALEVTLLDGDTVVSTHRVESVVTDADDEYTGTYATMMEQGMKVLMSDSLREALRDLLAEIDQLQPGG